MTLVEFQTAAIYLIVFILIGAQHLVNWAIRSLGDSDEWYNGGFIIGIVMIDLALIAWSITTLINLCIK